MIAYHFEFMNALNYKEEYIIERDRRQELADLNNELLAALKSITTAIEAIEDYSGNYNLPADEDTYLVAGNLGRKVIDASRAVIAKAEVPF